MGLLKKKKKKLRRRKNYPYKKQTLIGDDFETTTRCANERRKRDATRKDDLSFFDRVETEEDSHARVSSSSSKLVKEGQHTHDHLNK